MAKDPVCNMNIDEKTAKYTSEINGNKVYLCSSACKQQLEQNPSKYGYLGKSNTKSKESKFLSRIYLHIFFLLILFFPYIFHYNQFYKNCNKKSVPSLQILKL